jgi:hypothetical protein
VTGVVGVHHPQRPELRAVQGHRRQQVRRGLSDSHDLDEPAAGQPDLLAGPGRVRVDDVRGDVVEQPSRPRTGIPVTTNSGRPYAVSPVV